MYFKFFNIIDVIISRFLTQFIYKLFFNKIGSGATIFKPYLFHGVGSIYIGSKSMIRKGARIEVVDSKKRTVIYIGNNVNIEQNCHIVGLHEIIIEDDVSITGNCSIVDVVHPYDPINTMIKIANRISPEPTPIRIGRGTMIGFGAHIGPGTTIGCYSVVGAGSVVKGIFPDKCIIAGNPARIIKQFNETTQEWVKIG
ncbi:hexapeptide repeat-containing transferase [Shewanella baltica BA175]|uniref:acyltransferase n=1 Tax=Shewanella baltica TaxID=62322 RepID=UPI0001E4B7C3|nr:acyltransferase [Shewanella baltica]AEG10746.1 hexapeptide repeat-containing transferase [Shewanella baltica BA175]